MQHAALKLLTFFDHLFFNGYFSSRIVSKCENDILFSFKGEKYLVNKTPKQC